MALRSVAAKTWAPAADALRRPPDPGVGVLPPAPAPPLSRFLGTTVSVSQAKLLSNLKRIQQEQSVYLLELESLLVDLENFTKVAKQRNVELEQFGRQKKKAQMVLGFSLAAVACMTAAYVAYYRSTPMVEQGNTSP